MIIAFSKGSVAIIAIIAMVAIILSIISYQYSTSTANTIFIIASDEVRSNAEIQAHDFSTIVEQELDKVTAILKTLATAPAIHNNEIQRGQDIINLRQETTSDITDAYFWLDENGKLVWSSKFANNQSLYQEFKGSDLSDQPYFTIPRKTSATYYSSVLESAEGVPKIYISMPIINEIGADNGTSLLSNTNTKIFKGVIVASIRTDTLGNFVKNKIPPGFESSIGLVDKNGIILYTDNQTYIGKDYFGKEFQSTLSALLSPSDLNNLNGILRHSLQGNSGTEDIAVGGQTTTIAYTPVTVNGDHLLTLYITSPHQLAGNVSFLIDQQRTLNTILLIVIGAVAAGIAVLVLVWNKRLTETVRIKTSELKTANESLIESNKQLAKVNEQLVQANEQLKNQDKMQREFINIAAHELRTPTQAILGYSELFYMRPEDRDEAMKAVARNANRLERLTNDILDVTKIEGNALNLTKEKFNISEVISAALEDVRSRVTNGNIEFVYQCPGNQITVEGDKARITQVVSNLLSNSAKFTQKGTIFVDAEQNDSEVVVTVKDAGTGIHSDMIPRLFTKFASKSQTGTGLGLFISKSIIEAHGGKIWGENNKDGKGATFGFTLPISKENK